MRLDRDVPAKIYSANFRQHVPATPKRVPNVTGYGSNTECPAPTAPSQPPSEPAWTTSAAAWKPCPDGGFRVKPASAEIVNNASVYGFDQACHDSSDLPCNLGVIGHVRQVRDIEIVWISRGDAKVRETLQVNVIELP